MNSAVISIPANIETEVVVTVKRRIANFWKLLQAGHTNPKLGCVLLVH